MVDAIYQIITSFVLLHPWITIYLAGSTIAGGLVYSLMSGGYLDPPNKKKTFIISALSSWAVVLVFLYGFAKGFLEVLFENNKGGH